MTLRKYKDGQIRMTVHVNHVVGSQEIAMVLFTHANILEDNEELTRFSVVRLVRYVARRKGTAGLWPDCGVNTTGSERTYAECARRAVAIVRRLWPELDDEDLAEFEKDYCLPGVEL